MRQSALEGDSSLCYVMHTAAQVLRRMDLQWLPTLRGCSTELNIFVDPDLK